MIFDPGDVVLKSLKIEKPRPLWRRQLAAARLGIDRVIAVGGVAKSVEPDSVRALGEALEGDPFWAVRAAAARALGATRRDDALDLLLATIGDPHPRVRRAVVAGLGEYRGDERAGEALAALLQKGDRSYFVEAEAALSLGRTRTAPALDDAAHAAGAIVVPGRGSHARPSRAWAPPATSGRSPSSRASGSRAARSSGGAPW